MLIGDSNDVLISQGINKDEEGSGSEGPSEELQKLIVTSEASRSPSENVYNQGHGHEDASLQDGGRSSVVSDPGYISCAGSDRSSVLSVGEQSPEEFTGYNSTEYNAVISPCNTSITDVLNDTYIASNRNSPSSDSDSTFGRPVDFMSSPPHSESSTDQLERGFSEKVKAIQPSYRYNQAMPSGMNWSSTQQKSCNSVQTSNCDQRMDFDMFFDGVLESKCGELGVNANNSSIFSNTNEKFTPHDHNIQTTPLVPFVQHRGMDLTQNQCAVGGTTECKNLLMEDFSLSVEDFCFEEEILGNTSNMQDNMHDRTLSPCSNFSSNEMQSPQRAQQLCKTSKQYGKYNEDCHNKSFDLTPRRESGMTPSSRRAQSRVFAKASGEKTEGGAPTDAKQRNTVPTTAEEEAWRLYLENPLTAAATAMMSIQGHEDSAVKLDMLYDHYKVPTEKRLLSYPSNISGIVPARTLLPQKNVGASLISTGFSPSQKGSTVAPKTTMGVDVITLRPVKNEPRTVNQVFDSVSDIIKMHRPTSMDDSKVKKEADLDAPQDLSNPYSDGDGKLPSTVSRSYLGSMSASANANNNNSLNATSNFTTLSPYGAKLQESLSVLNSGQNVEYSGELFEYVMEAPKSLKQKEGDPTMSYINKGQFYCITLKSRQNQWKFKSSKVKSVVHIVFGDGKSEEEQLRHWKYWHARQHTVKQRIIDIADYKESNMIYEIDEISHNAISFSWNVNEIAKIFISCNCLSTDFSAQKGIKGLPLLLQIDTYVDGQDVISHRGQCQIKVFCDKGAERKIRDEERKATKRRQKSTKRNEIVTSASNNMMTIATPDLKQIVTSAVTPSTQSGQPTLKRTDYVVFKSVNNFDSRPVLFVPEVPGHGLVPHPNITPNVSPTSTPVLSPNLGQYSMTEVEQNYFQGSEFLERGMKRTHSEDERGPVCKISRPDETERRVLLYVRQSSEEVYDGLMLKTPDLMGLKFAIQEKYGCKAEDIKEVFKKSKKGIMVRMDDNIIRHYSNEDTFVIEIQKELENDVTTYKVTLAEV